MYPRHNESEVYQTSNPTKVSWNCDADITRQGDGHKKNRQDPVGRAGVFVSDSRGGGRAGAVVRALPIAPQSLVGVDPLVGTCCFINASRCAKG